MHVFVGLAAAGGKAQRQRHYMYRFTCVRTFVTEIRNGRALSITAPLLGKVSTPRLF